METSKWECPEKCDKGHVPVQCDEEGNVDWDGCKWCVFDGKYDSQGGKERYEASLSQEKTPENPENVPLA